MTALSAPPPRHGGVWPGFRLGMLPDEPQTVALAERVRVSVLGDEGWDRGPLDVAETCVAGRFQLQERALGAAGGGLEALLVPRREHFELVVDAEPPGGWELVAPALRAGLARHRLRFRAAHEWAQSFFYARTVDGIVRRLPDSADQERFCDQFARALLVPASVAAALPARAASVTALQRRFDGSLELSGALAQAHPQAAFWVVVTSTDETSAPLHAMAFAGVLPLGHQHSAGPRRAGRPLSGVGHRGCGRGEAGRDHRLDLTVRLMHLSEARRGCVYCAIRCCATGDASPFDVTCCCLTPEPGRIRSVAWSPPEADTPAARGPGPDRSAVPLAEQRQGRRTSADGNAGLRQRPQAHLRQSSRPQRAREQHAAGHLRRAAQSAQVDLGAPAHGRRRTTPRTARTGAPDA